MAKTETQIVEINGTEIAFYPKSHQYRIDKKIIPSVTSILGLIDKSRPLLVWAENLSRSYLKNFTGAELTEEIIESAVKQYAQKRDDAADTGHQVHDWISQFILAKINGTNIPEVNSSMPGEVINGINGFVDWYNSHDVDFCESEKIVYSKEYNYIGTFDVLMYVDGEFVLGDFKTGRGVYPEFQLQLAAYHQALMEEDKYTEIQKYMILHFNKEDGSFETVEYVPNKDNFEYFNNLLKLKRFLQSTEGR